jgi:hypothetical protein
MFGRILLIGLKIQIEARIFPMANEYGTGWFCVKIVSKYRRHLWKGCWLTLLILSETVVSISEDPFPFNNGNLRAHELKTLFAIRRNVVNVFRQLSKSEFASRDSSIITLPIRKRIGDSEEETAHRPTDSPGLLFYYLFEDWYTTYSLVSRREHQYAAELDRLVSVAEHDHHDSLTRVIATGDAGKSGTKPRRPTSSYWTAISSAQASIRKLRAHHRTGAQTARTDTGFIEELAHSFQSRLSGFLDAADIVGASDCGSG